MERLCARHEGSVRAEPHVVLRPARDTSRGYTAVPVKKGGCGLCGLRDAAQQQVWSTPRLRPVGVANGQRTLCGLRFPAR